MSRERDRDMRHDRHDDRRGGASRGGGRGGGLGPTVSAHTNSDNPRLLMSRVFIGNLPTDRIQRMDVEDIFMKYGKIIGKGNPAARQYLLPQLCAFFNADFWPYKSIVRATHCTGVHNGIVLFVYLYMEFG